MDAGRLQRLGDAQRRLLLRALWERRHAIEDLPVIPVPDGAEDDARLLPQQEALLLLETVKPGHRYNRIDLALDLAGPFDIEVARLAAWDVATRHEALRTTFEAVSGRWAARVHRHLQPDFQVEENRRASGPSSAEAQERGTKRRPFDISTGPLWRIAITPLAEDRHRLNLSLHHAIADGWSLNLIAADWAAAYAARNEGDPHAWRSPAMRPRDVARFLVDLEVAGIHPRAQEAAAVGAQMSRLAPDRAAPRSDVGAIVTRTISATLHERAVLAAGASGTTPAALHLAAAALAIARFTNETEITLGVAMAGRDHPALAALVAPLTMIRRLALVLDPSRSAAALAESIRSETARPAGGATTETFGFVLIFQNANSRQNHFAGLTTTLLPSQTPGILHDIVVVFQPLAAGSRLAIEYDPALFSEALVRQFADHLLTILADMAADPRRTLGQLAATNVAAAFLDSPDARNDAGFERPAAAFLRMAREQPDAIALAGEHAETRYGDLAAAAEGLAATLFMRLEALPAPAGMPIAILTHDSTQIVIAMLAAHLVRRPFLVLDPAEDCLRLAAIAAAARPALLLHQPDLPPIRLAAAHGEPAGWVSLAARGAIDEGSRRDLGEARADESCDAHSRAYIAFTSGSTGTPKGIVQSERAFARFLGWQARAFGLAPASRIAMWSSPSFDACYTEVFGALCTGATLCIPDAATRRDPAATMRWLEAARLDYLLTIPSFLQLMLADAPPPVPALRHVAVSGEVLSPALCERVRAAFPSAELTNLYGPTEAILATWHRVGADDGDRVPVGRPIAGRRLLLLDPAGGPAPRGAVGEIAIASRHLTLGYLDAAGEGLTPFPPFPDGEPGERLYRTGDLGRVDPGGLLHFLGRGDAQVKIRGHRLCLPDIETALSAEPGIRTAAATIFTTSAGETEIAAFMVLDASRTPEGLLPTTGAGAARLDPDCASRLRSAVRARHGSAAAPSRFCVLAALPLTATGKIDRRALRRIAETPEVSSSAPASAWAENPTMSAVADVWAEVLGTAAGIDTNLFDAGGTSFSAIRLHRGIEARFPGRITLRDVFDRPTIRAMSLRLDGDDADDPLGPARGRAGERRRRFEERARRAIAEETA